MFDITVEVQEYSVDAHASISCCHILINHSLNGFAVTAKVIKGELVEYTYKSSKNAIKHHKSVIDASVADGAILSLDHKRSFSLERSGRFVGDLIKLNMFMSNFIDKDSEISDIIKLVMTSYENYAEYTAKSVTDSYVESWGTWT